MKMALFRGGGKKRNSYSLSFLIPSFCLCIRFIDTDKILVARSDWQTKQRFASEIASGMALVHSLGRMHRDLKSGNILATIAQGQVRLKVADFGTATIAGMSLLHSTTTLEARAFSKQSILSTDLEEDDFSHCETVAIPDRGHTKGIGKY